MHIYFLLISLSSGNFYLYSFVTINFFFFLIFVLEVVPEKKHKSSKLVT